MPHSLKGVSLRTFYSNSPYRTPLLYLMWGDAAGAPIENLSAKQIDVLGNSVPLQHFVHFTAPKKDYTGYGYIYSFGRNGKDKPEPTDDSVVAFLSAQAAVLEHRNPDKIPDRFFEMLKAEVKLGTDNKFSRSGLGKGRQGFGGNTVKAVNGNGVGHVASNGGMPRVIGLAFHTELQKNEAQLVELSKKMVRLTHHSQEGEDATAAYALLLAKISKAQSTDQKSLNKIFHDIATSPLIQNQNVKALFTPNHYKRKPSNDSNNSGYLYRQGSAWDALQVCTWILHKHLDNPNPEKALEDILRHGQDTDSNAALALAALGATKQSRMMPQQVKPKLEGWSWT